jgi:twitching motility protein PilT
MARIDSFFRLVVDQRASDLHFTAGTVPIIRYDGDLVPLQFRELTDADARQFLIEILSPEQRDEFERTKELDFIYDLPGVARFRANYFLQARGMGAVFRVIPYEIPTIEGLKLPTSVRRFCQLQNGLVLITGPTGAGKTTTLAALVNEMNKTSSRHILTVEDPIEFMHRPIQSVVTQRQVGRHVESFAAALRSALREAPDVLVVGEMRDLETIHLALSAAETGVLVIGTLHTGSAAKAADRIVDAFDEDSRDQVRSVLSVLLKGVVSQHLVKRASGEGRIVVTELVLHSIAVANMIRENKTYQLDAFLQTAEKGASGMHALDSCLERYVREGIIEIDEALKIARYPDALKQVAAELEAA